MSIDCTSQLCNSPFVTRVTRRVSHVEQELLTHPEHLSLLPVFMLLDLNFCVYYFSDRSLFFWPFSFGRCVVCPSSIYGFWLSIWYLQIRLRTERVFGMPSSLQVIVAAYSINVGGALQIKTSQHYSLSPASSSSLEAHDFISTLLSTTSNA